MKTISIAMKTCPFSLSSKEALVHLVVGFFYVRVSQLREVFAELISICRGDLDAR